MPFVIYLRKSRADAEAELRGEGETLSRHKKILLDLAKRQKLHISEIYQEIVSGETISSRPVMQKLLTEVEQGMWEGVLVVELERLGRGDSIDQGLVAQAFKYSNTKIITPNKTYIPNDSSDEDFFEFGLFMSRREYKTINRRMQSGRVSSVKEGKYVGNLPPYGYLRKKLENQKGFTLELHPDQSKIVEQIFDWYVNGIAQEDGTLTRLGVSLIVRRLNQLRIPPQKSDVWVNSSIQGIIRNPVYAGKTKWNSRPTVKKIINGEIKTTRPRQKSDQWILADGIHPAIIDLETFEKANNMINTNRPNPCPANTELKNPLAGIVKCGMCGRNMIRRPYALVGQSESLMCPSTACKNVSSPLHAVESKLLLVLAEWLNDYSVQYKDDPIAINNLGILQDSLKRIESEITTLNKQYDNIHNLLEQGIYSTETFLERSKSLNEKIAASQTDYENLSSELKNEDLRLIAKKKIIPSIKNVIDTYNSLESITEKNKLLKEVLEKTEYIKYSRGKKNSFDNFKLILFPKL